MSERGSYRALHAASHAPGELPRPEAVADPPPVSAGRWTGWLWVRQGRGGRWERVCQANDIGTCSRRLSEIGRRRGVPDKLACMTRGGAPAEPPACVRRAKRP
jgi:hypothetical protein